MAALEAATAAQDRSRRGNRARVLEAIALRRLGRADKAAAALEVLLSEDPLDHWAACESARLRGAD